jgi:hypothetical protein
MDLQRWTCKYGRVKVDLQRLQRCNGSCTLVHLRDNYNPGLRHDDNCRPYNSFSSMLIC